MSGRAASLWPGRPLGQFLEMRRCDGAAGSTGSRASSASETAGWGGCWLGSFGSRVEAAALVDPKVVLKLITPSSVAQYLAYPMKCVYIHGKYDGTTEADGDSMVLGGHKVGFDPAAALQRW